VYTNRDPRAGPSKAGRHCVGTWLSLVEHSLGVRGVGSSNLPVPTIFIINKLPLISEYSIVNDRNSPCSDYGENL
jgi:hypothetical protein